MQNDAIKGGGNDIALDLLPVDSYLKYRIKGKEVTIVVMLTGIRTVAFSTSNASSFVIDALPFNFKTLVNPQQDTAGARCTSHAEAPSGVSEVYADSGANRLCFSFQANNSYVSANRLYEYATTTSRIFSAKADLTQKMSWTISGSFTFELD